MKEVHRCRVADGHENEELYWHANEQRNEV